MVFLQMTTGRPETTLSHCSCNAGRCGRRQPTHRSAARYVPEEEPVNYLGPECLME